MHLCDPSYSHCSLRKIWHNLYMDSEMVPCQMLAIALFCNQLLVSILSRFVTGLAFGLGLGPSICFQIQIWNKYWTIISSSAKFLPDTKVLLYGLVMKSVRCIQGTCFSLLTRYIFPRYNPRYKSLIKISYYCIRFTQWPDCTLKMSYGTLKAYAKANLELGWAYLWKGYFWKIVTG